MNEIKIILRVKYESYPSHVKLACYAKEGENYQSEFTKLKEDLNLKEEAKDWGYAPMRFTNTSKSYVNKNDHIMGLIIVTSKRGVHAIREIIIKGFYRRMGQLCVDFSLGHFVLVVKEDLLDFFSDTIDEDNRFLGRGARATNQMCHYVERGDKLYELVEKTKFETQAEIQSEIIKLFGFFDVSKSVPRAVITISSPKNQIFYGPPGTGKTFKTKSKAVGLLK